MNIPSQKQIDIFNEKYAVKRDLVDVTVYTVNVTPIQPKHFEEKNFGDVLSSIRYAQDSVSNDPKEVRYHIIDENDEFVLYNIDPERVRLFICGL